jgi:hypothetical protein
VGNAGYGMNPAVRRTVECGLNTAVRPVRSQGTIRESRAWVTKNGSQRGIWRCIRCEKPFEVGARRHRVCPPAK